MVRWGVPWKGLRRCYSLAKSEGNLLSRHSEVALRKAFRRNIPVETHWSQAATQTPKAVPCIALCTCRSLAITRPNIRRTFAAQSPEFRRAINRRTITAFPKGFAWVSPKIRRGFARHSAKPPISARRFGLGLVGKQSVHSGSPFGNETSYIRSENISTVDDTIHSFTRTLFLWFWAFRGWLDLSHFACHQLNGSFNALSALRKTVHWANQEVFELNENAEPIAFIAFRRTKVEAMRRWAAGGSGGNTRINFSTHEWDGIGDHQWRWRWALTDASDQWALFECQWVIQCAAQAQSRMTRSSSA